MPKHLKEFLSQGIKPSVNQIEIHPLFQDNETITFCQENGIELIGYAPLATSDDKLYKNSLI